MVREKLQDGWKIEPKDHCYDVGYVRAGEFYKFSGVPSHQAAFLSIKKLTKRYGSKAERYFAGKVQPIPKPGPQKGLGGFEIDRAFADARTTTTKARTSMAAKTKKQTKAAPKKSSASKKNGKGKLTIAQVAREGLLKGQPDKQIATAIAKMSGKSVEEVVGKGHVGYYRRKLIDAGQLKKNGGPSKAKKGKKAKKAKK